MNDSSTVSGNTAGERGGGVFNTGTFMMTGASSVWGNTAGTVGGGILNFVGAGGTLVGTAAGVNVYDNTPEDIVNADLP